LRNGQLVLLCQMETNKLNEEIVVVGVGAFDEVGLGSVGI
jgi:hypothetical protein